MFYVYVFLSISSCDTHPLITGEDYYNFG